MHWPLVYRVSLLSCYLATKFWKQPILKKTGPSTKNALKYFCTNISVVTTGRWIPALIPLGVFSNCVKTIAQLFAGIPSSKYQFSLQVAYFSLNVSTKNLVVHHNTPPPPFHPPGWKLPWISSGVLWPNIRAAADQPKNGARVHLRQRPDHLRRRKITNRSCETTGVDKLPLVCSASSKRKMMSWTSQTH